jgi:hypothetical protein
MVMERRRGWILIAVFFLLTLPLAVFLGANTWWDEDEMPIQREAITSGHGFEGTDEYDPLGDDHLDLPLNAPLARILSADTLDPAAPVAHLQIQRWTAERKDLRVETQSESRVALRLLNYPAWRVEVNNQMVVPERMDDVNQMVVPVKAGNSEIRVRFVRTIDRVAGNIVSGGSGIAALFLLCIRRKRISEGS